MREREHFILLWGDIGSSVEHLCKEWSVFENTGKWLKAKHVQKTVHNSVWPVRLPVGHICTGTRPCLCVRADPPLTPPNHCSCWQGEQATNVTSFHFILVSLLYGPLSLDIYLISKKSQFIQSQG